MADDTRDPTRSRSNDYISPAAPKEQSKTDFFKRPDNANVLAGGTENTAGGKTPQLPTFSEQVMSVRPSDYKEFTKQPCVRESLLFGIASGFAVGGVRLVAAGNIKATWKACNWAVWGFLLTSMGAHYSCTTKAAIEKENMKRFAEAVKERESKMQRARERKQLEEARLAREEAEKAERERKSWYKFW